MLTIIGDVHGKSDDYLNIIKQCEYSVQVGDLGFDYSFLGNVDHQKHKFVPGNHDCYDIVYQYKHCLGDFGTASLDNIDFFFVRGAFSIDCLYRVATYGHTYQKTWWYEEELNDEQCDLALDLYKKERPDIMITHDCPVQLKPFVSNSNIMLKFGWDPSAIFRTQKLLTAMFEFHRPKLWLFGHYHQTKQLNVEGTLFQCINELDSVTLEKKGCNYIINGDTII